MEILPQIPGICVSVCVADKPAEEAPHLTFAKELDDGIAATQISPLFNFLDGSDAISFMIFSDDIKCQYLGVTKDNLNSTEDFRQEVWFRTVRKPNGDFENYSLTFQEVSPVEGANRATLTSDLERVKALGTIRF
ncbi:hypothetical protein FBEOM_9594 [Fusarium beomiforme]|uniref:Uncharacterized protein n=1 Tax=Fusarium beomiforme TaxID=44412 RepID=A0A9P5DT75_9HYPO|nr:hypothetical protein FBEOM_9594 [Fusarium beomiforme]